MTNPTTTIQLLAQGIKSARIGDIDTVEGLFDIVSGWVLGDSEREQLNEMLAELCAIADRRDDPSPNDRYRF